jgi:TatD DNase family protein
MTSAFLTDSHCHLKYLRAEGIDMDLAIAEAESVNVKIINNICADIADADEIIEISKKYKNVYCCVGHHPEEVKKGVVTLEQLLEKLTDDNVIGVGESGLDYHYEDAADKKLQKKNFEAHIEAARRTKLPLVVHSRDADAEMMDMLSAEMKNGEFSFELHCFCSGRELAFRGLDLGGYVSFSGILTFKGAIETQNVAKAVPLDRIMVETDAPFLAPVPFRGKACRPAYVKNTAEFLAKLLGKDYGEIERITTENFLRLFNGPFTPMWQ